MARRLYTWCFSKALNHVANEFHYSLIALEPYLDAFFIRNDLVVNLELPDIKKFSSFTGMGTKFGGKCKNGRETSC